MFLFCLNNLSHIVSHKVCQLIKLIHRTFTLWSPRLLMKHGNRAKLPIVTVTFSLGRSNCGCCSCLTTGLFAIAKWSSDHTISQLLQLFIVSKSAINIFCNFELKIIIKSNFVEHFQNMSINLNLKNLLFNKFSKNILTTIYNWQSCVYLYI